MTDVSLCSCSPISKIINGNPFTGKTLLCCREILPYFSPSIALVNVGRFLVDFLLLPLSPALEPKGCKIQNTFDYKNFWERSCWSSFFGPGRKSHLFLPWNAEMLYFRHGAIALRCSSCSGYPGTLQNQKHSNHHLLSIKLVVAQLYICMSSGWNWVVTCGGNEMRWWMRLISHYFKKISSSLNRSASERRNRIMILLIDTVPFCCFAQSQAWEMISHLRAKLNSSIRG